MTFWEHLDELRGTLLRILVVVIVVAAAAFYFKGPLFNLILAPKDSSFITYRLIERLVGPLPAFEVGMVNIELAQQFLIHVKMSLWAAALVVSPYILYLLFRFVSPALYKHERRVSLQAVLTGYLLFLVGVLLSYFVIFPLTFRFLGTYQVDASVTNVISLNSYISVFLMLLLVMGIVFELPVLCWLLARMGVLSSATLRKYRRHAVVVIIALAAIITPTGDAFTLAVVSVPIWLLYEVSIVVTRRVDRRRPAVESD